MSESLRLTVDGQEVSVPIGATLSEAVEAAGQPVPHLCWSDHTTPMGLCRLCVVEVDGDGPLRPACVTPVAEGMQVGTQSPRLTRTRQILLDLLNSTFDLSEADELVQSMESHGISPGRPDPEMRRELAVRDDNPAFIRDYAKCVLCWRCVQVCADDAQYTFALTLADRGYHTRVSTSFDAPLPATTCVFCGQCVGTCPTGALKGKREQLLGQGIPWHEILEQTRVEFRKRGSPAAAPRGDPS